MGFQQKSRGIRIGPFEVAAVVLAALTAVAGTGWWFALPRATWLEAPARVVAVAPIAEGGEGSATDLLFYFEYVVAGRVYRGQTRLDRLGRMRYGALPPNIMEELNVRGYTHVEDLPPEAQELLRERGLARFDAVPVRVAEALGEAADAHGGEVPEEVKGLLRAGDYTGAARAAGFSDERIAALTAESVEERAAGTGHLDSTSATVAGTAPLPVADTLRVRYDPENPAAHELVRVPYTGAFFNVGVFIALVLITLAYCGVVYPAIKQR